MNKQFFKILFLYLSFSVFTTTSLQAQNSQEKLVAKAGQNLNKVLYGVVLSKVESGNRMWSFRFRDDKSHKISTIFGYIYHDDSETIVDIGSSSKNAFCLKKGMHIKIVMHDVDISAKKIYVLTK